MWLKLLLVPVLIYGAVLIAVFLAQTALLFPTWAVPPARPLPAAAEQLALQVPTGEHLSGTYIPGAAAETGPLILGFGGNAWNGAEVARYLHELYPQADVAVFHYRGYGPSEGRPSADALLRDAPLIYDRVRARSGERPVVAVGFSIGAGVAAALAARRPLAGAILVTPFDSLTALASDHYAWLPVSLLLRHRMEPAADLQGVLSPVAIVAAERDTIIAPARTEALRRVVPDLAFARTINGAGHNDLYQRPEFHEAMRQALEAIEARSGPGNVQQSVGE